MINSTFINQSAPTTHEQQGWLLRFKQAYCQLDKGNLTTLKNIYHNNIKYQDPFKKIHGIENLLNYLDKLYSDLIVCNYFIADEIHKGNEAAVYWTMSLTHPLLNGGKVVVITGHSHLKAAKGKVIYHRDYFDPSELLRTKKPVSFSFSRKIRQCLNAIYFN